MKRGLLIVLLALAGSAAFAQAPDFVFTNGKVFQGAGSPFAQAVAVRGNRIVAVGTNAAVIALAGPATHTVDAGGRVIVPGINDAHMHPAIGGEAFQLVLGNDPSWSDIFAAISFALDETPGDRWITGEIGPTAYNTADANVAQFVQVAGKHPVLLRTWSGHACIINPAGLQRLRIDTTADPEGGWWIRDAQGHATGIGLEYADVLVTRRLADTVSIDDTASHMADVTNEALRRGITTIQMMPRQSTTRFLSALTQSGTPLRNRVIDVPLTARDAAPVPGTLPSTITVSGVKFFLDGTPLERTAWLRGSYPGDGSGRSSFTPAQIDAMWQAILTRGQQPLFHAVGDRTLAGLFAALNQRPPATIKPGIQDLSGIRKLRPRVEHGDGILPDLIPAAKLAGVTVVQNPTHFEAVALFPPGAWFPLKSLVDNGIPLALGSDASGLNTAFNPWLNVALAVRHGSESLTREQAVDAYTKGSAFAESMEATKGKLASGMLADLAVLSQDVFTVPADALPATESVLTMIDGKVAYATIPVP